MWFSTRGLINEWAMNFLYTFTYSPSDILISLNIGEPNRPSTREFTYSLIYNFIPTRRCQHLSRYTSRGISYAPGKEKNGPCFLNFKVNLRTRWPNTPREAVLPRRQPTRGAHRIGSGKTTATVYRPRRSHCHFGAVAPSRSCRLAMPKSQITTHK